MGELAARQPIAVGCNRDSGAYQVRLYSQVGCAQLHHLLVPTIEQLVACGVSPKRFQGALPIPSPVLLLILAERLEPGPLRFLQDRLTVKQAIDKLVRGTPRPVVQAIPELSQYCRPSLKALSAQTTKRRLLETQLIATPPIAFPRIAFPLIAIPPVATSVLGLRRHPACPAP